MNNEIRQRKQKPIIPQTDGDIHPETTSCCVYQKFYVQQSVLRRVACFHAAGQSSGVCWERDAMADSMVLFLLAGLAEIGGGYLGWLWLREAKRSSVWSA